MPTINTTPSLSKKLHGALQELEHPVPVKICLQALTHAFVENQHGLNSDSLATIKEMSYSLRDAFRAFNHPVPLQTCLEGLCRAKTNQTWNDYLSEFLTENHDNKKPIQKKRLKGD